MQKHVNEQKDMYPFSRMLSEQQFAKLRLYEKAFLMIQWAHPDESIFD